MSDICKFYCFKLSNFAFKRVFHLNTFSVNRNALKCMIPAIIFPLLHQLCAAFVFLTYGTKIVAESGTELSTETATILLGVAQLVGNILASQFVDSSGRKLLLILSLVGCAISNLTMTAHMYLYDAGIDTTSYHWLPIACMVFNVFIASVGILSLLLVCLVELFPVELRSFGMVLGVVTMNASSFFIMKLFPVLCEIINLQGCLLIFGFSCIFGACYVVIFVNETKGKDLNFLREQHENESSGTKAA